MVRADPDRAIEGIARRSALLAALRGGPRSKRSLVDELPVSRSTVDRAVRQLESIGLVERSAGEVALTLAGQLALSEYEEYRSGLEGLGRAWDLLGPVPSDADLDLDLFRGAAVVGSERHAPHKPVASLKEFLRGTDRIRGVASAVLPEYVEVYSRLIVEEGTEVDLVVTTAVLETLVAEYTEPLEAALETGRFRMCEVETNPPFSTIISHKENPVVGVVVYGETGIAGFIRNDSPDAVEWARNWIETWEERARPVGGPEAV